MNENKIHIEKRIEVSKTWADRMVKLIAKKRKTDPYYCEADFCREHNIDQSLFNKNKNLRVVPSPKTFNAIEKAYKKEKV